MTGLIPCKPLTSNLEYTRSLVDFIMCMIFVDVIYVPWIKMSFSSHLYQIWPATWKPIVRHSLAIGAMCVFSYLGPYVWNFSFSYPGTYPFTCLPSLMKAKRKLLRWNQQFLTSVSIYLVSTAACAQCLLLIRILVSWLFRYGCIPRPAEQTYLCGSYQGRRKLQWQWSSLRSIDLRVHFRQLCLY